MHWNSRLEYFKENYFNRPVILAYGVDNSIEEYFGQIDEDDMEFVERIDRLYPHVKSSSVIFIEIVDEGSKLCKIN